MYIKPPEGLTKTALIYEVQTQHRAKMSKDKNTKRKKLL